MATFKNEPYRSTGVSIYNGITRFTFNGNESLRKHETKKALEMKGLKCKSWYSLMTDQWHLEAKK